MRRRHSAGLYMPPMIGGQAGQGDEEVGAFAFFGDEPDAAGVAFDHAFDDGEADAFAIAGACAVNAVEDVEHFLLMFRIDADAVVADPVEGVVFFDMPSMQISPRRLGSRYLIALSMRLVKTWVTCVRSAKHGGRSATSIAAPVRIELDPDGGNDIV